MAKGTGAYDDPILVDGLFTKKINGVKKFFKLNSNGKDYSQLQAEINNTIEQLRLNTNNSITALQTSIDRHTKELDNCVRITGGNITGNLTVQNKNVDVIEEQGDGYIRYANGIQICWGNFIGLSTENKNVYFQKPFLTGTPSISVNGQNASGNASGVVSLVGWVNTFFIVKISIPSGGHFIWHAIGEWK